ncbi:MAG: ATP-binding cassette domain-containing protein [Actinomycetota bacterium]
MTEARAAADAVLDLLAVGVTIDGRTVLDGVDWAVEPGQHWAVLGPNGGGKSTLLRVAGLGLHPSRGTVRVLGHELGRVDIRPLKARLGVSSAALVDQLRPRLTADEVVRCGRYAALEPWWHDYDDTDRARAAELLAQVGLKDYGDRTFGTLSSGERQRVLLARALMPDPALVLLDEPTAGLDFGGREELVAALERLAAEPSSPPSVLVTHRVEDIPATTTHLLAIAEGRAMAAGPIGEILTGRLLSELFALPVAVDRLDGRWTARAVL